MKNYILSFDPFFSYKLHTSREAGFSIEQEKKRTTTIGNNCVRQDHDGDTMKTKTYSIREQRHAEGKLYLFESVVCLFLLVYI